MRRFVAVAGLTVTVGIGCGGGNAASKLATAPAYNPTGQAKCSVTKSQAEPLIVEWPSAARAKLEAETRRGVVVVQYVGCEMRVLGQCTAPVKYGYIGTTRKRDRVTMRDADDLYANMPLSAARLESTLSRSGELNVAMTIVGRYEAERSSVRRDELQGDCADATHVVSALTVGAFDFFTGADAAVGAGMTVAGAGAGARSRSERTTLNQDGEDAACTKATRADKEPPEGCGALLRIEVLSLGESSSAPSRPSPSAPPSPPPSAPSSPAAPPLGPASYVEAESVLDRWAKSQIPNATTEGEPMRGSLADGAEQSASVTMMPGRCYSIASASGSGAKLGLRLAALPLNIDVASGTSQNGITTIGGRGKAVCPKVSFPTTYRAVVRSVQGSGPFVLRVYSEARSQAP